VFLTSAWQSLVDHGQRQRKPNDCPCAGSPLGIPGRRSAQAQHLTPTRRPCFSSGSVPLSTAADRTSCSWFTCGRLGRRPGSGRWLAGWRLLHGHRHAERLGGRVSGNEVDAEDLLVRLRIPVAAAHIDDRAEAQPAAQIGQPSSQALGGGERRAGTGSRLLDRAGPDTKVPDVAKRPRARRHPPRPC
jgi:hypothetical protein